ncbi:MAG: trypsin-like peptidase domain-containing protein, partial [Thermoleophilia bacterium]|nr:trypsin-like peptidase domain-containing protein [Thermoleophilia bacterium]
QLARQYAQFEGVNRTFELVAKAVSPAVVHIVAQKSGRIDETNRVRHFEETGSGVIVRADRGNTLFVLTNHHVIDGAQAAKINIFLQDGRAIRPEQAWLDPKADIAVLSLGRSDLPYARLGNSDDVKVGSWVLALGSPFGLMHSVSQGIISARGRHMDELQDVENQDFLQTDAAINPGNSGGPLVNMKGEVIGINNSIASESGGNEGVGFSIPINLARWIMNQLIARGKVTRGALGIDLHPSFRPEDAQRLGLERPRGAWVDMVHPGSPAARGGLKANDVVVRFQGIEIVDLNHLINMVSMADVGQVAELLVWRDRQFWTVKVQVGERERTIAQMSGPAPDAAPAPRGGGPLRRPDRPAPGSTYAVGLELQTVDEPSAEKLGLPKAVRGAVVLRVAPESPLASHLQALDVIHAINGHPVRTAEEASRALSAHASNEVLLISFDRLVEGKVESKTVRLP